MNPVVQTFAGLLLLLVLLLVMSGIARVSEWVENDRKEDKDNGSRDRKDIQEHTKRKDSSDSGKTGHSS